MNEQQALGFLIAGTINTCLTSWTEDDEPAACCPDCCGPCAALRWYRDNAPLVADRAVEAITRIGGAGGYDWQNSWGGIDWVVLHEVWSRADRLNCHTA